MWLSGLKAGQRVSVALPGHCQLVCPFIHSFIDSFIRQLCLGSPMCWVTSIHPRHTHVPSPCPQSIAGFWVGVLMKMRPVLPACQGLSLTGCCYEPLAALLHPQNPV